MKDDSPASSLVSMMLQLADLYAPIAADLDASERIFRDALISDQGFISDLIQHVSRFHGKRLRPALTLLMGRACGNVTREHQIASAVLEMVHIATLVHDDVLDEADIRRRSATVNRLWGNERAVLMGDFLISHAFHLCSMIDSQRVSRLVGETTNRLCEGEMMQVVNRGNFELSEEVYFDIIGRKTASLVGTCCLLGAELAGAAPNVVEQVERFGYSLGIAFQITDDILDLIGEESAVGKSLGRDLAEGKLTLPLIHRFSHCDADEREEWSRKLAHATDADRSEVVEWLGAYDSIDYARSRAKEYVRGAQQGIQCLPESDAKTSLSAMAEFVLLRNL